MSIRSLDWSPLGLDADPVHADPDVVDAAQKRYTHIATTIDDAVAKLQQIVETNSDSLAGQYVGGLKDESGSLKDRLGKAAVRYHDVATQIGLYEPDLDRGLSETAGALTDAEDARNDQTKAQALPDPQKNPDGTTSPAEQQKGDDKKKAEDDANAKVTAAQTRLNNALDALNVAGKRFGDAVNSKNYDDGLTDSYKDKLDAVMAKISQIFGIIGMILGVLAILIPGVDVLVLAGVVAGAVSLVANAVLYHDGKGSVLDVVLGALGLGLAGLGGLASVIGKGLANEAKGFANLFGRARPNVAGQPLTHNPPLLQFGPDAPLELNPIGGPAGSSVFVQTRMAPQDFPVPQNAATGWTNMSDWFNNPGTNWLLGKAGAVTPEFGFWQSAGMQFGKAGELWGSLFSNPLKFGQDWAGVVGGYSGFRDLSAIRGAIGDSISPLWFVWGGLNGAFGMGGLIYTGGRLQGWIPAVNPPGVAT
ncbi:hypothetical protein ABH931_004117 [Streptacidiphilus sp. MAP12-33]|uniref:WXG100 family type VII secretion target n=1 Tax=Streptacidiphilus sp. MAP12-33 TaxID=3156266 RepID=UPI003511919E